MLQIHHIVEQSDGGSNDPSNLIAICLTCHSDVHTDRPFTRRFTSDELKMHRDSVFRLVAEGKLIPSEEPFQISLRYEGVPVPKVEGMPNLPTESIDILIEASESEYGQIYMNQCSAGFRIYTDRRMIIQTQNPKDKARYKNAMDSLEAKKLIEAEDYQRDLFCVTHQGFLTADQLLALRASTD